MRQLQGKVALVTGASSGIGLVTARHLAAAGARVGLAARRLDRLETLREQIQAAGGEALVLPCDVADRTKVEETVRHIVQHWGPVQILVSSAGFGDPIPVAQAAVEDIARVMQVNYLGAVYAVKAVLGEMLEAGAGSIVLVSSILGRIVMPSMSAYCATKHAMCAFGEGLAGELHGTGVRVSLVCPGGVDTEFFQGEKWSGKVIRTKSASAERVARDVLHAIRTGKVYVYSPRTMGFLAWLYPNLGPLGRWMGRQFAVQDR